MGKLGEEYNFTLLVKQIAAGEGKAETEFYRQFRWWVESIVVHRFTCSSYKGLPDPELVVNDILLKVIKAIQIKKFDLAQAPKLRAFVASTTKMKITDEFSKVKAKQGFLQKIRSIVDRETIIVPKTLQMFVAHQELEAKEWRNQLNKCIESLPQREKFVIIEHYLRGRKYEIIRKALGLQDASQVANLSYQARKRLMDCLKNAGFWKK
ncbi:sigma-70 family RNA polymerase sigma factor [candidate division KSB1 bacterium]|nr:sigma-70 family RNA polymerase sigma factor [candidate division KSB1 bacterium]